MLPSFMQCKVTPEMFWQFRRGQLGGKSAIPPHAELPQTLAECNEGVQADHYAQACYAMASYIIARCDLHKESPLPLASYLEAVPVPPLVSDEKASQVRKATIGQMFVDHGVA